MGNNNPREGKKRKSLTQAAMYRMYVHMIVVVLMIGFLAAGAFYLLNGRQTAAPSPAAPPALESSIAAEAKPGFDRLKGRWQRPDGGYVMDIKDIDSDGTMAAAYFNPRPINVSQATAAADGSTLKVFIELRDVNYPGATYHLTYDPGSDQLHGIYFQPALQQSFQVVFMRMR